MANSEPVFIEVNPEQHLADLIASYEAEVGKPLYPAQPERLILNAFAYRETLLRQAIQDTSVQNLIRFATAPILDELGELLGVKRLAGGFANCSLEFTYVTGHADAVVPAGTRVASLDGRVVFVTTQDAPAPVGVSSFTVDAVCLTAGLTGNGYVLNTITQLLDPQTFIDHVANTGTTTGGTDTESDAGLRERIQLAPAAFSNAGSSGAYKYWARTAHPSIIDVAISSPTPGTVEVFPLVETGITTPAPVISAVIAALNDETVRPLTDTVIVTSPTAVNYTITVNLVRLDTAISVDVIAAVTAALTEFVTEKRLKLGRDITASQLVAVCMLEGVYTATLPGWTDVIIAAAEFPKNTAITVNVTGTNVG